jgi:AcrR family transcriptional regulator
MASPNVSANRAAVSGDGEDRRAQILRVSAELFAERGYASTTVRNIAERTGLLSGSLYHHFDSKESILEEILTDFFDELTQRVQRAIEEAGDDPAVAFRKLIHVTVMSIEEYRPAILVLQNEWSSKLRNDPRFKHMVKRGDEIERMWTGVLKAGIDEGVFRSTINPSLLYWFTRDTIWVVARWYQRGKKLTLQGIAEEYCEFIFNGIVSETPNRRS